jgi:hypothetical protein
MLRELHAELSRHNIALRIVGARGRVRDLLRADGMEEKLGGLDRRITLDELLAGQKWTSFGIAGGTPVGGGSSQP